MVIGLWYCYFVFGGLYNFQIIWQFVFVWPVQGAQVWVERAKIDANDKEKRGERTKESGTGMCSLSPQPPGLFSRSCLFSPRFLPFPTTCTGYILCNKTVWSLWSYKILLSNMTSLQGDLGRTWQCPSSFLIGRQQQSGICPGGFEEYSNKRHLFLFC